MIFVDSIRPRSRTDVLPTPTPTLARFPKQNDWSGGVLEQRGGPECLSWGLVRGPHENTEGQDPFAPTPRRGYAN
ncbi:MAG: hypothetical protein A3F82_07210 [Deltaproteobacteria bacterium RIFCSPLOWO2_12_FULL_44_12]|nr:MAG: hypothetical protein A3F82_07210 [Deltaproteobacteria bacterium RIFCSPLOWO2_12_FULL_44_12]